MTEWLLPLLPAWGPWLVAATTFLSCLALPVPASLVMLSAGAFSASGDLALWQVAGAAFAGAVLGDHAGFTAGRRAGAPLLARLARSPGRGEPIARAREKLAGNDLLAVFLSRWLLSPLGPWVNLAGGAAGMPWHRFTPPVLAGEAVWVAGYTGLGYLFADRIVALAAILGNLSGALAAAAVAVVLGMALPGSLPRARTADRDRR